MRPKGIVATLLLALLASASASAQYGRAPTVRTQEVPQSPLRMSSLATPRGFNGVLSPLTYQMIATPSIAMFDPPTTIMSPQCLMYLRPVIR
jgi:hypothetical protein